MASSWSLTAAKDLPAELRLGQAISEFQTNLTAREKIDFQVQSTHYSRQPPTTQDVYKLTAEIDHACAKASGGRVFGPRFMNVLQAVQRFASIGDVLIGGSQNLIACGVWAGVRFALMAMTTSATLMNKISELFMQIGRHAPRYEELAHLYPESKSLQNSLLEYFVVIVQLCHYVLKYSQKTKIGHFMSSMGDSELEKFRSDLETRGRTIKDEVSALTMSLIKAEASRSERFRARYLGESQAAIFKREAKLKAKILKRCSEYEHDASWKQLRKAGTAQLFLQDSNYQAWKTSLASSTMLWAGRIGSGKSVLLANIVDDLNLKPASPKTLVTYFFCQWDVVKSLQARVILGSLANQVLKQFYSGTSNDPIWQDVALSGDQIKLEALTALILKVVPKDCRIYFVLDGLDDCAEMEAFELCTQLARIQSSITFNVCSSVGIDYRSQSAHRPSLKSLLAEHISTIPEQNPDIAAFIDNELARRIQSGQLVLRDGTLVLGIRDALLQGAQGMMLWVALQIEAICAEKTDEQIRQALEELPTSLSEVFARELKRHYSKNNIVYRDRAIALLLSSVRPLNVDEFSEAISVEPGNFNWQPAKHVNDVRSILTCCGRLVLVDEESLTVRLCHHSIKKYLLSSYNRIDRQTLSEFKVHLAMADIVTTYLSYGVFDRQVSTRVIPPLPARHVAPTILAQTFKSNAAADLAIKLLQLRRTPDFDLARTVASITEEAPASLQETFPFRNYAEQHFMDHAWSYVDTSDQRMYNALKKHIKRLCPTVWMAIEKARSIFIDEDISLTLEVTWSSQEGNAILLSLLNEPGRDLLDIWDIHDLGGSTCLQWAIGRDIPELLTSMIKFREYEELSASSVELKDALLFAIDNAYFNAADTLIDFFSTKMLDVETIMVVMIQRKNFTAVLWLFDHGFDPNTTYDRFAFDGKDASSIFRKAPRFELPAEKIYPLLFLAVLSESAEMVRLCLRQGSLVSGLAVQFQAAELHRVFPFLVRNEYLTLYKQIMFANTSVLTEPWYNKFVGRKARALLNSNSSQDGSLSIKRGDIIDIKYPFITSNWQGAIGSKRGSFDAYTVDPITEVEALYNFVGTQKGQLSFQCGDTIEVVPEAIDADWWVGRLNGEAGYFPVNYARRITLGIDTEMEFLMREYQAHSNQSLKERMRKDKLIKEKEEQLRKEEEQLRIIELKVQREIHEKRKELLAREAQLKEIEARMQREQQEQQQSIADERRM